jgi:hypothetical protein
VAHDKYSAETGWEFEARLDALNIELSDLIKLSREERCRLSPTNPEALKLIDELARFQAVQKDLKSYSFAVQFQGEPLDGMAVNRPVMISRIHREGYTIDLLEGALAMVKDRTIKPTIMKNVVSVESLMQALGY